MSKETKDTVKKATSACFRSIGDIVPNSIDKDKRTVDVVWTTGSKVLRGYYEKYYEVLSTDPAHVNLSRLNNGAPFLSNHSNYDLSDVLGVVVTNSAFIKDGKGLATIRFSKAEDDENADKIFRKICDGILQKISIGYFLRAFVDLPDSDGIPTKLITNWEPFEISCVTIAADDGAGFRSLELNEFIKEVNKMPDVTPTPAPVQQANPGTTVPAALETRAGVLAVTPAADLTAERARVASIRSAVQAAVKKGIGFSAEQGEAIEARAVQEGLTVEQARGIILEEMIRAEKPISTTGFVEITDDAMDKRARGIEAWIVTKAGMQNQMQEAKRHFDNKPQSNFRPVSTDPGEFRGMRLLDLARSHLDLQGVKTRGMRPDDLIKNAFNHRGFGGMHSTSDFPNLLENVLHKILLGAYAITPDNWSQFCLVGSVSDFRPTRRNRMGSFNRLDKLNEHGEYKNKSIPDSEKELIAASTLGNIIGITRESIINDDMDAFSRLAPWLGRAAKLSIEMDVFDLIKLNAGLGPTMDSDGLTLFHATHLNIGTGAAISTDSLDKDATLMATQTDVSKNEILDLNPSILIIPRGLRGEANSLNESQYDTDTAGKFQKPNKVRGLFNKIVATARLTGTRRYLLADPNIAPTIEVVFLDGVQEPYMMSQEGWRNDGWEWKVRMDYGVDAVDFRGAVTNAGV